MSDAKIKIDASDLQSGFEDFGVKGASTLCTAAATFRLIAGSIMGVPVGKRLIEKKNLLKTAIILFLY